MDQTGNGPHTASVWNHNIDAEGCGLCVAAQCADQCTTRVTVDDLSNSVSTISEILHHEQHIDEPRRHALRLTINVSIQLLIRFRYGRSLFLDPSRQRSEATGDWQCDSSRFNPSGRRNGRPGSTSADRDGSRELIVISGSKNRCWRRAVHRVCSDRRPDRAQTSRTQTSAGRAGAWSHNRSCTGSRPSQRCPQASQLCSHGKTGSCSWEGRLGSPGVQRGSQRTGFGESSCAETTLNRLVTQAHQAAWHSTEKAETPIGYY
jgi:hypothetical protein